MRRLAQRPRVLAATATALALGMLVPPEAHASLASSLAGLMQPPPAVLGPLTITQGAQAELADLVACYWVRILPGLKASLGSSLATQIGQSHGAFTIDSLQVTTLDLTTPPRLTDTPIGTPQYAGEELALELPGDPSGWHITLTGNVTYLVSFKVFGLQVSHPIKTTLTIDVANLRAIERVDLDTVTDPTWPTFKTFYAPTLDFDLTIQTSIPQATTLLGYLQPVIHAAIAYEVNQLFGGFAPVLGQLQGKPGVPFGSGGPAFTPFGQTPDLHQAALMTSDDIQNDHTPFGTVYSATFSQPVYRQGVVTGWSGMGDSPIWTGSYLTGEALRYATTKDPLAQTNAKKVVDGLKLLLDVQNTASGRLSRYAVPVSSPFAQTLMPIGGTQWIATVAGVSYVCDEDISRDQYLGTMMGLAQAYQDFDDPALKQECSDLIQRVVDFLESSGWNALRRDGTISAPFVQSTTDIIGFTAAAELTNPAKYAAMRAEHGRAATFDWVGTFFSALDPQMQYFKWNLGHSSSYLAMRLETDPDRYKGLERGFAIMRHAVGFHRNSWFDGVEAALDASQVARLGPIVTDDLYRLVSRGRRDRTVTNSTDPTIAQAVYTPPFSIPGGQISFFGQTASLTSTPTTCAQYPIPVEKRPNSDFEWQRNPFDLDGAGDPHNQQPGVDIVLPYWLGKNHGFVP